jgi:hypothetical protein
MFSLAFSSKMIRAIAKFNRFIFSTQATTRM